MIDIVGHVPDDRWKSFLDKERNATLHHTPEWKRFLEKTFSYQPQYLFATTDTGELAGLLPLFYIRSRLTGDRLCSVPFSPQCGCLGDREVCAALFSEAIAISKKLHSNTIEIRSPTGLENFKESCTFSTYLLSLSSNPEEIRQKVHKSARRAIKKSEQLGVTVTTSTQKEDLKEFYEINRDNKQLLGVPCHPWKFFENLFAALEGYVYLYLSHHNNTVIAGGIMECYKDTFLYGYGAADPGSLHVQPYYAFIWKSIEDACHQGYKTYDFGRVSSENSGLIEFKKKWGTEEKKLCYSVYPLSSKLSLPNRDTPLFRLGNTFIRKMPLPVYTRFSDSIFAHFG